MSPFWCILLANPLKFSSTLAIVFVFEAVQSSFVCEFAWNSRRICCRRFHRMICWKVCLCHQLSEIVCVRVGIAFVCVVLSKHFGWRCWVCTCLGTVAGCGKFCIICLKLRKYVSSPLYWFHCLRHVGKRFQIENFWHLFRVSWCCYFCLIT